MSYALLADALTLARLLIAPALAITVGTKRYSAAAVLLAIAWTVDYFDGMAARAATHPTRLGWWDPVVDALVGAGILAGLQAAGHLPAPLVAVLISVLLGGMLVLRNLALGMVLQAIAYVAFAVLLFDRRPTLWWVAFGTALALAVVGGRRLFQEIFPKMFSGFRDLVRIGDAPETPRKDNDAW